MKGSSDAEQVKNRRSFLRGTVATGAAIMGGAAFGRGKALAQDTADATVLTKGDIAILRFLAAAELIESDLWQQYAELGGLTSGQPIEVDPNQQLNSYQAALSNLDSDGPSYITRNWLDEVSHATFLNGFLQSKGVDPVDFSEFKTLQGSTAAGAVNIGRLTNLMHLNVDTSWYIRYRSATNPDLGAMPPRLPSGRGHLLHQGTAAHGLSHAPRVLSAAVENCPHSLIAYFLGAVFKEKSCLPITQKSILISCKIGYKSINSLRRVRTK